MNTIRNYLETMFAHLPNTPEVLRAKDELWQMMEDKYTELIAEGKTENEAVGTVISEFGNLEELADDLGLKDVLHPENAKTADTSYNYGAADETVQMPRREVSYPEVRQYLQDKASNGFLVALGVYLCITCAVPLIAIDGIFTNILQKDVDFFGVAVLFVMIVVAICLFTIASSRMSKWEFLKKSPCTIDYATAEYLNNEKARFEATHLVMRTIGIILCAICWLPAAAMDNFSARLPFYFLENIMGVSVLEMVGVGVFLIVFSSYLGSRYDTLLDLNDKATVSGTYRKEDKDIDYGSPLMNGIMSVYWSIVTCIYLIISFTTFNWGTTWIIWIIAGILKSVIDASFGGKR